MPLFPHLPLLSKVGQFPVPSHRRIPEWELWFPLTELLRRTVPLSISQRRQEHREPTLSLVCPMEVTLLRRARTGTHSDRHRRGLPLPTRTEPPISHQRRLQPSPFQERFRPPLMDLERSLR